MPVFDLRPAVRWMGIASCVTLVVAACTTDRGPDSGDRSAKTGTVALDLQSSNFNGNSLPNKTLALTFDDGPGDRTIELSQYLKAQGIKAAFFMNGARFHTPLAPLVNANNIPVTANGAAILAQVQADGHLVANHTTTHRDMQTEVPNAQRVQEVTETDAIIDGFVSPANHLLFRAPYGSFSSGGNTVFNTLNASPMKKYIGPIYWEAGGFQAGYPNRAADWACWQGLLQDSGGTPVNLGTPAEVGYATTTQCGDAYLTEINAFKKGIVLMHDPYSWANGSTVDMVKYLVPLLKAAGYSFVRVDEIPDIAAALPCDLTCATCAGPNPNQCSTCAAGRYKSGGQCLSCKTCGGGEYQAAACGVTTDTVCTACSACTASQYQAAACSANTDTVCGACSASCTTCTGPAANQCATCDAARYLSGGTCAACAVCAPGTFQATACTATQNTVCAACHPSCIACSGPNADQCGSCPTGFFKDAGKCTACAVCPAGSSQQSACGPSTDATCAPCAAGTFAAAGATSCSPCAAGTSSGARAAACTSCGSCDDGNACTTDRCDTVKGCVHDAITNCSPTEKTPPMELDAGADAAADADADAAAGPVTFDEGGCSVSPGSGHDERGMMALAFLGLSVLMRRRRRTEPRAAR